jgi:hypothetical protein
MKAGDKPGDPEVAKSLSLAGVFDWYQDCPEQIERAVIMGGAKSVAPCDNFFPPAKPPMDRLSR